MNRVLVMLVVTCLWSVSILAQEKVVLANRDLAQFFKPNPILFDSSSAQYLITNELNKFDVSALPIFCRNEYKWSQLSGINVRLRLGSLDYVNKLENK